MVPCLFLTTMTSASSLAPVHLRCEALVEPVGVASSTPRFSWKLESTEKNAYNLSQTAYRITVGRQPGKADLWDSGRVKSDAIYGIRYAGTPLASGQKCWWQVQVTDQNGGVSDWSKPASFSVGLLSQDDWKADWIGFDMPSKQTKQDDPFSGLSWIWGQGNRVSFKNTVELPPGWTKATAWVTVDDQFDLIINGTQVAQSDRQTDAWRRPVIAEIGPFLKAGANQIEIIGHNGQGEAGLLARFEVTYADGKTIELKSDGTWKAENTGARVLGQYGMAPWGVISQRLHLPPARYLRRDFSLGKTVKRATLYGTALGLLELHLNGRTVSDELFMPGWTNYEKRVYARAYDVTKMVKTGENAIGIVLGDGWYSGFLGYSGTRDHYGSKIRARAQLMIEYSDGTTEIINTDKSWRASTGPILYSDFLMGEAYDASLVQSGWNKPGFASAGWSPVDVGGEEMKPLVEPFPGQPVVAYDELKAKTITEPKKDAYVLDLGQNFAGFARIKLKGKKGQKITLRFAERLNPDGTIYTTNLRGARATDTYTFASDEVETWEPKFTFHGFQYIEVSGLGRKPKADEFIGVALSSDTPTTGTIETSDKMINQLVSNAWWTQRMNFIDIPTDCPQRDERLGWTGDAQAYIRTASMFSDVQPFFTKWLVSLEDSQRADGQFPMVAPLKVAEGDGGPAWADAGVICPWSIYEVYGDKDVLTTYYPSMKRFIEFCVKRSTPDLLPPKNFHCFGDWLNIDDPTPHEVIYTAYFAGSARLTAQTAEVLGNTAEAREYRDLYKRVRAAFQKAYVTADGKVSGDSQCAYVLALAFDLLDEAGAKKAADHLVANIERRGGHLSTGFVGTRDIMHVLSKIGRNDIAFRLLHNTTFPSWGFTIVNGATSIWERWDGWTPEKGFQTPGMNSFAHYAFGAVVGWMFDQPAGISELEPGFRTIKIAPQIDPKLTWLKSSYASVSGDIVSEWSVKNGKLTMKVVIPPNTTAEIYVPATQVKSKQKLSPFTSGAYRVGSGEYVFEGSL